MLSAKRLVSVFSLLAALATPALALEYPIGVPQQRAGMEIAAVYLQPVEMEPEGMMRKAMDSDIHLEADIHALANNPNGFEEGAWIPYLLVKFEVSKIGGDYKVSGDFMPMVANDGPHYGDNVKLDGPGKYKVTFNIEPPAYNGFYHHVDKETGTKEWWKPFQVAWDFAYVGTGKKGGY